MPPLVVVVGVLSILAWLPIFSTLVVVYFLASRLAIALIARHRAPLPA